MKIFMKIAAEEKLRQDVDTSYSEHNLILIAFGQQLSFYTGHAWNWIKLLL
ncbi:hypothetical protein SAMN05444162_2610 [Paenibacillaceae bacterium GAS479]|nr:hypothetical protein SAMN05444162_2610 [Paenibacillaceae bacterium GAS479]